ncbi:MAG: molybdenum cofactor biosynthesis protein MoaE [Saprospiraceae bacterium]
MTQIEISENPLDVQTCIDMVLTPETGGINVFFGSVRNVTKGKIVVRLEFEAYTSMALKEMKKIADAIEMKWPVLNIVIHHRTGVLSVGEIPVIIAVSAAHRHAAFSACQFAIDQLKEKVPIWKKEIFVDGEERVSAHP